MKADLSRSTFAPERHYSTVLMQQGRVQVDADWNEQQAIHRARIETEAADQIGASGTRIDDSGFGISIDTDKTLKIGKGRIYVDGLLCENDNDVLYNGQPFLPAPDPTDAVNLLTDGEVAIAYLHARDRHITAFDQPLLREQALDGPDTTTRVQTTWQVKVLKVNAAAAITAEKARLTTRIDALDFEISNETDQAEIERLTRIVAGLTWHRDHLTTATCALPYQEWDLLTGASTGTLKAQTAAPTTQETRCLIPPGSGYSGLENQLYRVEIIEGGTVGGASTDVVRYVWSRENGSIVTPIVDLDPATNTVTVASLGPDDVLGFGGSVLVEISDDRTELLAEHNNPPGFVGKGIVDPDKREIALTDAPPAGFLQGILNRDPAKMHAKVRRWEGTGTVSTAAPIALEENIEVVFSDGRYRSGDYWLIPARAGRGRLDGGGQGTIEWPKQPSSSNPAARLPFGVKHHYCRLALINRVGGQLALLDDNADCRNVFPASIDLDTLNYVGGAGQTARADRVVPDPLQVAVLKGRWPITGARVLFETMAGGELTSDGAGPAKSLEVRTGPDGLASVVWKMADDTTLESQRTIAVLLDEGGNVIGAPVIFSAQVRPPGEGADAGIRIEKLVVGADSALENDLPVRVTDLAHRIVIDCDRKVAAPSVGDKPTCYVTLDLNWPAGTSTVIGTWPLKLLADVGVSSAGNQIVWQPKKQVQTWLMKELFQELERWGLPQRVLGQLTLKGNFIWAQEDNTFSLDGEAFGAHRGDGTTVLELPSGNGRRGGDFELWFWLEPEAGIEIPDWGIVLRRPRSIIRPIPRLDVGDEELRYLARGIGAAFDRDELGLSPGAIFPDDYDFASTKFDPEGAKMDIASAGLEGAELLIWVQPDLSDVNRLEALSEVVRRALEDIGLAPRVDIFPGSHEAMLEQLRQRVGDDRVVPDAILCDAPTVRELEAIPKAGFKGAEFVRF